jgi:hypothetical protein
MKKFWAGWKRFGQALGDFLARVVLTLFYFTVFVPFGLMVSLFSDPLEIKPPVKAAWSARTTRDLTLDDARRQG